MEILRLRLSEDADLRRQPGPVAMIEVGMISGAPMAAEKFCRKQYPMCMSSHSADVQLVAMLLCTLALHELD